jgi:hypothetical protein
MKTFYLVFFLLNVISFIIADYFMEVTAKQMIGHIGGILITGIFYLAACIEDKNS